MDTYAELNGLNTKNIIDGVCLDPRIGDYYNNPSFGYGGYCLPKDTKQLLADYKNIPEKLIEAVVKSNDTRKHHIASQILRKSPKIVGVYRLTMKTDSDNFRASAIQDIIHVLQSHNISIVLFEPTLKQKTYNSCEVENNFDIFCQKSDIILANRFDKNLLSVKNKIYTRDLFSRD